jgi:hypothetical protein
MAGVPQGNRTQASEVAFVFNPSAATLAEYCLNPFKTAARSLGVGRSQRLLATRPRRGQKPLLPMVSVRRMA